MKTEASRSIKECAYCSRIVEDPDGYTDLAPSGPVVYRAPMPGRVLPVLVLQVICKECRQERLRSTFGDYGRSAHGLLVREARAGF